jgi:hypothetical protein
VVQGVDVLSDAEQVTYDTDTPWPHVIEYGD